MTEREWWNKHVRKALNDKSKYWRAIKEEDAFKSGTPDTTLLANGAVARCEMKFAHTEPKRDGTSAPRPLSTEQWRWMEEWIACKGIGWVLIGFEEQRTAYLFDVAVYRELETWWDFTQQYLLKVAWEDLSEVMIFLSSTRMK